MKSPYSVQSARYTAQAAFTKAKMTLFNRTGDKGLPAACRMTAAGIFLLAAGFKANGQAPTAPELIVHNAKVTTLQQSQPDAQAFAVRGEKIIAVGSEAEIMRLKGAATRLIDARGRRVVPGLNDSHLHAIRGGQQYNMELRWDGVASLPRGLQMVSQQAKRTPAPYWVRVIGGWSPYQFPERRFPTIKELNEAAPATPTIILFAYSQICLNRAGARALKMTQDSLPAKGGHYEFVDGGLIVKGVQAVYAVLGKLPSLPSSDRLNSTQYYLRELNRFGLTSVVDAGGTGLAYPEDYQDLAKLAAQPKLPMRISNYLFPQKPKTELPFFEKLLAEDTIKVNKARRLTGYVLDGAGELLVYDATDYEDFMSPRPDLVPQMEAELRPVVEALARRQWPIRIHTTYDPTITRILDVFEPIFKETGYHGRWFIEHAEGISAKNIARVKAMGGGISVQNRLSFAGEFFKEQFGPEAAAAVQPLRAMLDAGIPLGGGTDATRVASYNPWVSLYWMVTGKTVGGTQVASPTTRLSRTEALGLYTFGSAWMSGEERVKGRIAPGQYADFAILTADYMTVPAPQINAIESVLTSVGGDIVYATGPFAALAPPALPPVSPAWSPVAVFGGYQQAVKSK